MSAADLSLISAACALATGIDLPELGQRSRGTIVKAVAGGVAFTRKNWSPAKVRPARRAYRGQQTLAAQTVDLSARAATNKQSSN